MAEPEILVVGKIRTLDPSRPLAEAVLVRAGRFACVGALDRCTRQARADAVKLELASAVPGLVDAHGHVFGLYVARREVSCLGAADAQACAELARQRARSLPKGHWVVGRGWDQNHWPTRQFPDVATLTRAVPDHPVLLYRVDGHAAWANAAALSLAGVGSRTPDPFGGRILRDPGGQPSGVLVDSALDLVAKWISPSTRAERKEGLVSALAELKHLGITGVHDAGVGEEELLVYRELAREDRLPIRVYAMVDGQVPLERLETEMDRQRAEPEVGFLTVRSVKLFADGALGSRGAALDEPYADDPGNRGLLVTSPEELRTKIAAVVRAGLQPCVHAIGDRAVGEVERAIVGSAPPERIRRVRPRIEHLQLGSPGVFLRLARLGVVASMQPVHLTSDAAWLPERLGARSQQGAYAWRSVLEAGMMLAFGSDFPVEEPDPRAGLYAAEARWPHGAAVPFTPLQRLSREEALRAFTVGSAYASFAEGRRGMIREGFDADLTGFGEDIGTIPLERLGSIPLAVTLVAGRMA